MSRESKKPRTAEFKGKRYRCAICRKRSPRKVLKAPYVCPDCVNSTTSRDD